MPDDQCEKVFGLSDKKTIKIPIYRGNSSNIDKNESIIELCFPVPNDLRNRYDSEIQDKPKIKISLRRKGKNDLGYNIYWVYGKEIRSLQFGGLSNEFEELAKQEEEINLKDWKNSFSSLEELVKIFSNFIELCEKNLTNKKKLNKIKQIFEKHKTEAKNIIDRDNAATATYKLSGLIKVLLEIGPQVIVYSSEHILNKAGQNWSRETRNKIQELGAAVAEKNEAKQHIILRELSQVSANALDQEKPPPNGDANPENDNAVFKIEQNLQQLLMKSHTGSNVRYSGFSVGMFTDSSFVLGEKITYLMKIATSLVNNYSTSLEGTPTEELPNLLNRIQGAIASNDHQTLEETTQELEILLKRLGYPAMLAMIDILDDEAIIKSPDLQRLKAFAHDKQNSYGRAYRLNNTFELTQLIQEISELFFLMVENFPALTKEDFGFSIVSTPRKPCFFTH